MKPTQALHQAGQSLWLDNITRDLLSSGTLSRYIDELAITGLTSNPTIFDHAFQASGAYAEGLNVLHRANAGKEQARTSAEIAPLTEPQYYQYDIDVPEVTEVWRRGSVVASWLLDLTAAALAGNPSLEGLAGRVSDSGEGRWTLHAAIDEGVPAPVLSAALYERFSSRGESHYQDQILSAMREQFGGHHELSTPNGVNAS